VHCYSLAIPEPEERLRGVCHALKCELFIGRRGLFSVRLGCFVSVAVHCCSGRAESSVSVQHWASLSTFHTEMLAKWLQLTRLGTRTKEYNMWARIKVIQNLLFIMKVSIKTRK
jgi:hypothetical protein